MRIAHVSDFHYTHLTFNPFRLLSKRFFGHFNWIFHRDKEFSPAQVDPLIDLFHNLSVDWVFLGGDFTTTAMKEEFEAASQFVKKIKQPWIAIPGNHDHYTYRSFRNQLFYRYFSNPSPVYGSLSKDRVEAHQIAPNCWVVCLDTARPTHPASSQGIFSLSTEKKLLETLRKIPFDHQILLFNHYPFFLNDAPKRGLERGEVLEDILRKDRRIHLYLHGHTHRHTIADLQEDGLPIVLDSGSCAQGPKGAWNLIDIDEKGCTVSGYRWNQQWYLSRTEHFPWKR